MRVTLQQAVPAALALLALTAGPTQAQVESWLPLLRPDPYFDFAYYPAIVAILRAFAVIRNLSGVYRSKLIGSW